MNIKKAISDLIEQADKLGHNPDEIASLLKNAVSVGLIEFTNKKYVKIIFDSPMGYYSAIELRDRGYFAKWVGNPGCRGETCMFLSKGTDLEKLKVQLREWRLTDKYSVISVRENYKSTRI